MWGGTACTKDKLVIWVAAEMSVWVQTLVEKSDQPSNFALKLRKHLRAKRSASCAWFELLIHCYSTVCRTPHLISWRSPSTSRWKGLS